MASTGTEELTYSKRGEGEGKRASYRAFGDTLLEDSRTSGACEEERRESGVTWRPRVVAFSGRGCNSSLGLLGQNTRAWAA